MSPETIILEILFSALALLSIMAIIFFLILSVAAFQLIRILRNIVHVTENIKETSDDAMRAKDQFMDMIGRIFGRFGRMRGGE